MTDAEKVLETMSALRIGPDVVSLGHLDKAHAIVEVPESEKCCGADFLGGHERDGGDFGFVPRRLVSFSESCSTSMLRSTNGVLAAICSLMIFEILSPLRPALTLTLATSSSSSISFSGKSYERRWRLGSCYHFEEVLTSGSIFVVFINGHSYRGLFQNTDLLQFVPNQACAGVSMALLDSLEAEMPLSSTGQKSDGTGKHSTGFKADYSRIVWDLERLKALSAQLSRKKMIFAFDGMSFEVFLASGTISMHNFVDPLSAAASTMGGIPQFGHYYGDIFICSLCVIGNIIRIAGGMAVVLAIVEASMTNDMLHMALSLLACALHKKPQNLHDMQVYRGYHLLALLRRRVVFTLLLSLYPIHWFFTFLYYTDVASATAVLAMYLACLRRHYWLSAMFGSLAIFIRQTNVIWMLFIASTGAIDYVSMLTRKDKKSPDEPLITSERKESHRVADLSLRKRKTYTSFRREDMASSQVMLDEVKETLSKMWHFKCRILKVFFPYILISGAFGVFVTWNGSVVLGAKDAHKVSPHFAQIFYFAFVSTAAMYPVHFDLNQAMSLFSSFYACKLRSFSLLIFALLAGFISIQYFSTAHPYLIADNRHYTFYLWRKVTKSHWLTKYLLIPLYVYSWFSILTVLGKTHKKIWCFLFFLACAAVLVPAPLIEFRYYTIPFYLIILNSKIDDTYSWFLMAIAYFAVNIFTMALFLFRPFHWNHESGTQRFIW